MTNRRERFMQLGSLVLVFLGWHFLTAVWGIISSAIIPPPLSVARSFVSLVVDAQFLGHVWTTVWRTTLAGAIAIPTGIGVGVTMGWSNKVDRAVSPILYAIYPMPTIALLPLVFVVFGSGDQALIFVAALGGFFLLVWNAAAAVNTVDPIYFQVARNNGANAPLEMVREVLLPATLSPLFSGIRVCLSTALLIMIATEFIAAKSGLGFFIFQAWRSYNLSKLYAGIFVVGLIGVAIAHGLRKLHERVVPWETEHKRWVVV